LYALYFDFTIFFFLNVTQNMSSSTIFTEQQRIQFRTNNTRDEIVCCIRNEITSASPSILTFLACTPSESIVVRDRI
jgi:hypothetical protein